MEFDKSKVFTALNADELKVGSKVVIGDCVGDLKFRLREELIDEIASIESEEKIGRFRVKRTECYYNFAYLIEEPQGLQWTDLKLGDIIKKGDVMTMVTEIDAGDVENTHICVGSGSWLDDRELEEYELITEVKQ